MKAVPEKSVSSLCFVGPMTGQNRGGVLTQGEELARLLSESGYPAACFSKIENRYLRVLDICCRIAARKRRSEILVYQIYSGPSFRVSDLASWMGKGFGHPVIMMLHGGNLPELFKKTPQLAKRVLSRAHAIVCPSEYLQEAVSNLGLSSKVIPNFIEIKRYPYRERRCLKPRLFWMRALHPIYNPEMAIRVLAGLRSRFPDSHLVLAGPDKAGMLTGLKKMAQSLGLEKSVTFAGHLDDTAKKSTGNECDIFLNTTRIDNMPVSVIEAQAMGLPVISTEVGGMRFLIRNGTTGILVPDNDHEAMTAAVKKLLHDPDLAFNLSSQGRRAAEAFSWENLLPQWECLLKDVMARRHLK